jgi:sulfatase maturation enzyme AslB (radical SAM superfamily)
MPNKEEILNNGVFCVMPWTHFAVATTGRVRPCSWESVTPLLQDDGRPYNVIDHDISIHHEQPPVKELKQNMLAGKKSAYCSRCYEQEKLCGTSKRTVETFNLQKEYAEKIAEGENIPIKQIELRLGNICNIGCLTCNPYSSSYFVKEIDKHNQNLDTYEQTFQNHYYRILERDLRWFEDEAFWDNIEKHIENVSYIYLAGGEPTIIKENWNFLKRVIDLGYSKNIKLGISTNLTNVQPNHIEIYNSFKETRIYSSIDGYGDLNDYVRYPSKWSAVSKNFEKLCNETNSDIVSLSVIPVISTLTIWTLDKLCDWVFEIKDRSGASVDLKTHTLLRDPSYLSMINLPDEAKLDALKIVNRLEKHFNTDHFQIQRIRQYLENALGQGDLNIFMSGKKYIENFDNIRNNSWKQYVPELEKYWS